MDATRNPFAPGAGTQPPELAGREKIIENARVALARVKAGRPARSQILLGLRGVGKTVLLNRIHQMARNQSFESVFLEAPEDRKLVDMLVPSLRSLLVCLQRVERAKALASKALAALRSFAAAFKVKVGDIEFGVEPARGTADSGDLDLDLPEVLVAVAIAARSAGTAVAILIDEAQYLRARDLSALIASIHKSDQGGLPLIMFAAGLPQLAGLAGKAKSYAERLFEYPPVSRLEAEAARDAIRVPIVKEGAGIEESAIEDIIRETQGYPYFLQEWGSKAWTAAPGSPIDSSDVKLATIEALNQLDQGFFRVRLDRLTPRERDYMRAMAELGPGPHRSGDIAKLLGIQVTSAGPLRNNLILKGMIYSQHYGETAFTVPMFDAFMKRTMPEWKPIAKRQRTARSKKRGQGN